MTDPHPSTDVLADLALDELSPHDGEALTRHLRRCPDCRRRYAEIASTVEDIVVVAPHIEPPPGFDRSVLTAMGMSPAPQPARKRRPRARLIAVAAVLGAVLGVGGTVAWTALDDTSPPAAGAAIALGTSEGAQVGTVTPSRLEGESVMVVEVVEGVIGREYSCVLVLADGREVPVGSWVMEAPSATWVVPAPETGVVEVRLVTSRGVWSSAELG